MLVLKSRNRVSNRQLGTSLLEVLVTMIILTFGLLGLAGLHTQIQLSELESYQRAQALLLLSDMTDRINLNRKQAASYVTTGTIGTGDTQTACTGAPGQTRDICEWRNALLGASEVKTANVGAMIGARGCITQVQAPIAVQPTCQPGIYEVDVVWQGMFRTKNPNVACGAGLYGGKHRAISSRITVGLTAC